MGTTRTRRLFVGFATDAVIGEVDPDFVVKVVVPAVKVLPDDFHPYVNASENVAVNAVLVAFDIAVDGTTNFRSAGESSAGADVYVATCAYGVVGAGDGLTVVVVPPV